MRERSPEETAERLRLANDAALDVDALIRILARQHMTESEDVSMEVMQKASLRHLTALNDVILCVLSEDDNTPTPELWKVVHG